MGRALPLVAILAVSVLPVGCGEEGDEPAAPEPAPDEGAERPRIVPSPEEDEPERPRIVPKPEPEPEAGGPAAEGPADPSFDAAVERVRDLESRAEFAEALLAARKARSRFRGHERGRELDALVARLTEAKQAAVGLPYAVGKLGSDDPAVVQIARLELRQAGDVGRTFLRKAVREAEEPVAAEAADVLARSGEAGAAPVFMDRLDRGPETTELRAALVEGLARVLDETHTGLVRPFYTTARSARGRETRDAVTILVAVLDRVAEGDPERFGELCGDPEALERLRDAVRAAAGSEDEAVVAWARRMAPRVRLLGPGLRGTYYTATDFKTEVLERRDGPLDFRAAKQFGLPDGRGEHFSIRWSGQVRVDRAGEYRFFLTTDDGVRLWVGARKLIDDWTERSAAESSGRIDLEPGMHPVRIEYYQAAGDAVLTFSWEGPGLKKQLVPREVLFSSPVPAAEKAKK